MGYDKKPNKSHLVAVQYGSGETVLSVTKCIYVNDATYHSLLNKKFLYDQEQIKKKNALLDEIKELKEQVEILKQEIKVLKGE